LVSCFKWVGGVGKNLRRVAVVECSGESDAHI
jgi:hypothetical protein